MTKFAPDSRRMIEAARKRSVLIRVATKAFEANGFEGVDLRKIAKDAEVSTGAIFNNFASKDALFAACFPADHQRRRVAEAICLAMGSAWSADRGPWFVAADRASGQEPFITIVTGDDLYVFGEPTVEVRT